MNDETPEWTETVRARVKRRNKVLFRLDDELLSGLSCMLEASSRKAVVLWALGLAEEGVQEIERRFPDDHRARECLEASRLWARGDVKMPAAKKRHPELPWRRERYRRRSRHRALPRRRPSLRLRAHARARAGISRLRAHRHREETRRRQLRTSRSQAHRRIRGCPRPLSARSALPPRPMGELSGVTARAQFAVRTTHRPPLRAPLPRARMHAIIKCHMGWHMRPLGSAKPLCISA